MAWLAVDSDDGEHIFIAKPNRGTQRWSTECDYDMIRMPVGSIEKLLGYKITWKNESVELKCDHKNKHSEKHVLSEHTFYWVDICDDCKDEIPETKWYAISISR